MATLVSGNEMAAGRAAGDSIAPLRSIYTAVLINMSLHCQNDVGESATCPVAARSRASCTPGPATPSLVCPSASSRRCCCRREILRFAPHAYPRIDGVDHLLYDVEIAACGTPGAAQFDALQGWLNVVSTVPSGRSVQRNRRRLSRVAGFERNRHSPEHNGPPGERAAGSSRAHHQHDELIVR